MDPRDSQKNSLTLEEALRHVAQLSAEVEEVRSRLAGDVTKPKGRLTLDRQKIMERSVEHIAGQAGTVVGVSIAVARKLFKNKKFKKKLSA